MQGERGCEVKLEVEGRLLRNHALALFRYRCLFLVSITTLKYIVINDLTFPLEIGTSLGLGVFLLLEELSNCRTKVLLLHSLCRWNIKKEVSPDPFPAHFLLLFSEIRFNIFLKTIPRIRNHRCSIAKKILLVRVAKFFPLPLIANIGTAFREIVLNTLLEPSAGYRRIFSLKIN